MRVEDVVAQELENDGYVVIRTYKRGCPDLIAIKRDLTEHLHAIEVKGPGDKPSKHQVKVIGRLAKAKVNASFRYVKMDTTEYQLSLWFESLSEKEYKNQLRTWYCEGYKAYMSDKAQSEFPRQGRPNSSVYYNHKDQWLRGWNQALIDWDTIQTNLRIKYKLQGVENA